MYLNENQFLDLTNMDQLKKHYIWDRGSRMGDHNFG